MITQMPQDYKQVQVVMQSLTAMINNNMCKQTTVLCILEPVIHPVLKTGHLIKMVPHSFLTIYFHMLMDLLDMCWLMMAQVIYHGNLMQYLISAL